MFGCILNDMKRADQKFLVGIDEVGRGPLAGPVAVGVALATPRAIVRFKDIKESKQLSRAKREEWYEKISSPDSGIIFAVSFVSAQVIDKIGITAAISRALTRGLRKVKADPMVVRVLLDGGLYAPPAFKDQETIIRGDAKETIIAIASVVAKVTRDRLMYRVAKKYPAYGFSSHVGYGTKAHYTAIRAHGLTPLHRRTFTRSIVRNESAT
jgi:ribonuclease HII